MKLKLTIEKDTCLHCVWVDAAQAKFPKYNGGKEGKDTRAWNDLVRSAIVIAGSIFSRMTKEEQVEFFHHIVRVGTDTSMQGRMMASLMDGKAMSLEELKALLESLGQVKN